MMMIVTKVSGGSEERSQPRAALCLQEIAGLETEQAGPPFKLKREAAVFPRCQGLELEPIPSKRTPEAGDDECVAEISKCEAVPTATQHKHLLLNIGRGPNIEYPLKMKRISGL